MGDDMLKEDLEWENEIKELLRRHRATPIAGLKGVSRFYAFKIWLTSRLLSRTSLRRKP